MAITNNKTKKRKFNLIIPKRCDHNLIIPNYNSLGFNLIIPKKMIIILLFRIFRKILYSYTYCGYILV